ncbi:MAG: helical backbone metal receptor [Cyclobacteriaceae bacterium]|jgi:ABC-type Fe3+-hydroxamate transport system substrate-binding protein|nr:helical backbone metal receptor [Cyclobacteriaceae bacterium]
MSFRTVTDQMQRGVSVPVAPQRIVSLVPSQTEWLFDLGLAERVVGVTKFCVHPAEARQTKTVVGGTKNFRFDVIDSLNPDLIIGNKEENDAAGIHQLAARYPVWMSDIITLQHAYAMMRQLAQLTDTVPRGEAHITSIQQSFPSLLLPPRRILYLIWKSPWMAVGANTFIHDVITTLGLHNAVSLPRYPELTDEAIRQLNPEVILLSSEPYPFRERHLAALEAIVPRARVMLVDGEMFSWYGSRLQPAAVYFRQLAAQLR